MSNLTSELNSLSQFCYSLMYIMLLLFYLGQTLAHKYSKILSFISRARWSLKALEVNICFKVVRINVEVQLMKLRLIYCQKSRIFSLKRARASTFAPIFLKLHFAVTIHIGGLACKISASYDNAKLCLNTV